MIKLIVDRFEEKYAVCVDENNNIINISISELPENIKEGSTIIKTNNRYIVNHSDYENRKNRVEKLMRNLWER